MPFLPLLLPFIQQACRSGAVSGTVPASRGDQEEGSDLGKSCVWREESQCTGARSEVYHRPAGELLGPTRKV